MRRRCKAGTFADRRARRGLGPGTSDLAALKATITYRYVETPLGGRVDIVTTDPAAVKAVHTFLKFQISDHKTGDSMQVTKRPSGGAW